MLEIKKTGISFDEKDLMKLEEIENGRRFEIRLTSIPGAPQTDPGCLNLKTNYPEKPEINIRIRGRFVKVKKPTGGSS
jgi:hypothetical protein